MTLEEFKKIIKPTKLLSVEDIKFIDKALMSNYRKWKKEQKLKIKIKT